MRVLGGAGTGKTVVAMHRARWLARNSPNGGRILFTTFTRNLAADIENNLKSICSPEEMARIEVTNLDRWVVRFLRGRRYESQIVFGRHQRSWELALDQKFSDLDLGNAFYRDEWERVVLPNGVTTEAEYRRVSRVGRGTRLHRAARVKVWRVFEEYRAQLAEHGRKEVDDAYRDAAALMADDRSGLDYTTVIVDEAHAWLRRAEPVRGGSLMHQPRPVSPVGPGLRSTRSRTTRPPPAPLRTRCRGRRPGRRVPSKR